MLTWSYEKNDELWQHGEFETAEDCIADAKENYNYKGETIAIGTIVPFVPTVNIDSMLEQMESDAYEECGEVSESWGISSSKGREKQLDTLQENIDILVCEYLKKIGEMPSFYKIEGIHVVKVN